MFFRDRPTAVAFGRGANPLTARCDEQDRPLAGAGRPAGRVVSLLAAAAALASAACAPSQAPEALPDILLITVDTLRADAIGCYGRAQARTPHLDRLASEGVRFEYAFAPRGATLPSLATILTGVSPLRHQVISNGYRMAYAGSTLAEALREQGYRTSAILTSQCGVAELDDNIGRGFDEVLCTAAPERQQWEWDRDATESALALLARPGVEPLLLWVHLMDPHAPHRPPAHLLRREIDPRLLHAQKRSANRFQKGDRKPDSRFLADLWELYDAEIEATDAHVGRLVEALRARRSRDAIVFFTSDHGEDFFDHDNFYGHDASIHDVVLRVPLIAVAPGRIAPGAEAAVFAELQDVFPTLLDLLGLPLPAHLDGRSLLGALQPGDETESGEELAIGLWHDEILSARTSRFRYVWNRNPGQQRFTRGFAYRARYPHFSRAELLYDLRSDPVATRDILSPEYRSSEPAVLEARAVLRERLEHWLTEQRRAAPPRPELLLDEAVQEELRALGYVDGPDS